MRGVACIEEGGAAARAGVAWMDVEKGKKRFSRDQHGAVTDELALLGVIFFARVAELLPPLLKAIHPPSGLR